MMAMAEAVPKKTFADLADEIAVALDPAAIAANQSTQQIYEQIRALEKLIGEEKSKKSREDIATLLRQMQEAREKGIEYSYKAAELSPQSVNAAQRQVLVDVLERRGAGTRLDPYAAALGVKPALGVKDGLAAFYAAVIAQEDAKQLGQSDSRNKLYEKAVWYWKVAGDAGDPGAYWNLAIMYLSGEGVMQSRLAAIEWDYKAGLGFLRLSQREKALAALEAIQSIDKNSPLARKLEASLAQSAPK